jgi:hypothetical protein
MNLLILSVGYFTDVIRVGIFPKTYIISPLGVNYVDNYGSTDQHRMA